MNIAFVINAINHGGAERQTVNLANSLADIEGNHVFLLTEKRRENEYPLRSKVERKEKLVNNLLLDTWCVVRFSHLYKIDVVIAMGIYANWVVCLSKFVYNHKVIVTEMNDPRHDNISQKSRFLRKLLYWRADGYIFQTEEEKQYYSKAIQNRGIVIPNPICTSLPIRNHIGKNEIVAVGRLMPQKNYPLLLQSFKIVHGNFPDYTLSIYGDGPEKEKLQELSCQLGISGAVYFHGFCKDVHQRIANSDIFVMSSDFEGMPNALMEAMGMGFPVVCTDCGGGGARALIAPLVNGVIAPIKNPEALAQAIMYMIKNPQVKEELGKQAMQINTTHSLANIGALWMNYCLSVFGKN